MICKSERRWCLPIIEARRNNRMFVEGAIVVKALGVVICSGNFMDLISFHTS
jgi:hypothetical protein